MSNAATTIVTTDQDGDVISLSRAALEWRIINNEVSSIVHDAHGDRYYDGIVGYMENGYTGVAKMTNEQLMAEWNEVKDSFYIKLSNRAFVLEPHEDDPLEYDESPAPSVG